MIGEEVEEAGQVLPSVVWRHVASLLDLAGQAALAATCRELMGIVVSLWRRRLSLLCQQIKILGENFR